MNMSLRLKRRRSLYIWVPKKESISVQADKGFLIQIIENLVSNAVKFSPPNTKVEIEVSGNQNVLISVKDEGPGITKEDQTKLFGKYNILSAKPTGGEPSTGLGLSIVKKYIEEMGGKVWCESQIGKGATFYVSLPN